MGSPDAHTAVAKFRVPFCPLRPLWSRGRWIPASATMTFRRTSASPRLCVSPWVSLRVLRALRGFTHSTDGGRSPPYRCRRVPCSLLPCCVLCGREEDGFPLAPRSGSRAGVAGMTNWGPLCGLCGCARSGVCLPSDLLTFSRSDLLSLIRVRRDLCAEQTVFCLALRSTKRERAASAWADAS